MNILADNDDYSPISNEVITERLVDKLFATFNSDRVCKYQDDSSKKPITS